MTDNAISNAAGQRGFSRRSFIKGAAVLGAAGALTGCSAGNEGLEPAVDASKAGQEQIFSGACRSQCVQGCS